MKNALIATGIELVKLIRLLHGLVSDQVAERRRKFVKT